MHHYDRPLLYDLWKWHHFSSAALAEKAGVNEQIILRMFQNKEVSRATAEQVLAALSTLIPCECSLGTVRVNINHEEMRVKRQHIQ